MTPNTHAYIRVSTDRQDAESQKNQINDYRIKRNYPTTEWYEDKLTSKVPWKERLLAQILERSKPGDILLVTEITRIDRSLYGVLDFLRSAQEKNLAVHVIKSALIVSSDLNSKITVAILGLAGEIERDMNNARARAGVKNREAKGLPIGRQPGTVVKLKLDLFKDRIPTWRAKKLSLRVIAKLTDTSVPTVKRWLRRNLDRQTPPTNTPK